VPVNAVLGMEAGDAVTHFTHYSEHVGTNAGKPFKSTLWRSDHLLLGLNCLAPGQEQALHDHSGQDKFYFVVEGNGEFVVGTDRRTAGPGGVVWAPAGAPHGVVNRGTERLVLLVGIAPFTGH
jgi:mannose-6-phosphate isomerase-like protein (cupin superfamily)